MLISTALLLDSIIRNSVCSPAKLPCRRVKVGYEDVVINFPVLQDYYIFSFDFHIFLKLHDTFE
jgi:hypothetical protein